MREALTFKTKPMNHVATRATATRTSVFAKLTLTDLQKNT